MVQTDISQLFAECTDWRQILRNYRDELHEFKKVLQDTCRQVLTKEQLHEVERFHNQFHIQLINIHDLKQNIKTHERQVELISAGGENNNESLYAHHEELLDHFLALENTLQELRSQFKNFISSLSC
ncbi:MAG: hypothetical protein ICV66_08785 [Chitinophagaceae bacterium]|nr:hypothetical protein [Chitinophagaceae bacterium]